MYITTYTYYNICVSEIYRKEDSFMKYLYFITFNTFGTGVEQTSYEVLTSKAQAEKVKHELESCGHTNVKIHRISKKVIA